MSVRGRVAWGLTVLWAGLGVAGAAFDMAYALRVPEDLSHGPTWVGESAGAYSTAVFGVLAWVLLAIPVLIAGRIRLGRAGRTQANALWVAAWLAEVIFAIVDATNQPLSPETWACDKDQVCDLSWGRYVSATAGQLVIFAIQLALLFAIASVLARGTARVSRRSVGLMSLSVVAAPFLVAFWLVGTAYAPRSVVLSGVVAECTRAEYAAQGDTDPRQEPSVVTVFLQNQAGQTVAAQRLPFRVAGARYRMRVLAGIYTLAIVSGRGDDSDYAMNLNANIMPFNLMTGNTMDVPVDWAGEQDFNAANESCLLRRRMRDNRPVKWRKVSSVVQRPASLIGSRVFQVKFDYQTAFELLRQEDDGTIGVHVDLIIYSPFALRGPDGVISHLDPATSRAALAPVIALLGETVAGVNVDGDDMVERDGNGNPVNVLGALTLDFAGGAQITVPATATPYDDSWELNYGPYL